MGIKEINVKYAEIITSLSIFNMNSESLEKSE